MSGLLKTVWMRWHGKNENLCDLQNSTFFILCCISMNSEFLNLLRCARYSIDSQILCGVITCAEDGLRNFGDAEVHLHVRVQPVMGSGAST